MADVTPSRAAADAPRTVYLTCAAFQDHEELPKHLTCEGEGVSPALAWRGLPGDTVEIAVVCEDHDVSGTFVHWMMTGIDSGLDGLDENVIPEGAAVGLTDAGTTGYAAPCPSRGEPPHRYVFTVFACADGLALEHGFTAHELHDALQGSVIAAGTLTGTFGRGG